MFKPPKKMYTNVLMYLLIILQVLSEAFNISHSLFHRYQITNVYENIFFYITSSFLVTLSNSIQKKKNFYRYNFFNLLYIFE